VLQEFCSKISGMPTDFQSTLKATHTWIQPSSGTSSRSLVGHRCAVREQAAMPGVCCGLWSSGLWTGTAALMRHSSRARALHARTWHRRPPLRLRFRLSPVSQRAAAGCRNATAYRGSRIHIRIHSRAGAAAGWLATADDQRAAASTVALHWQMEMDGPGALDRSRSRIAGDQAARAVLL
jgi:hypothetical protein